MRIAIGRFGFLAPVKDGPASGSAVGALLAGALAHVLAQGTMAQSPAPAWKDLEMKWGPDFTWGKRIDKSPTRMAADDRGNLFVSNGDSLAVCSPSGAGCRTAEVRNEIRNGRHTPVIAGPGGSILWGSWISDTREAGWRKVSGGFNGDSYSTIAIAPGYCLFGGSMDEIGRSAGLGDGPERVHLGNTFGSIVDFAVSRSGIAYAAPSNDDLLVSRDSGKTWKERQTLIQSDPNAPEEMLPASGLPALEPAYPEESLWMASRRGGNKRVTEYAWSGDSLVTRRHANLMAPDSAITAFRLQSPVQGPIILWLGTWGQGVFRSMDRGESWQAVPSGLGDPYIEALVEGSEGRIFALTREGLFSLSGPAVGLAPLRGFRPQGRPPADPAVPFLFEGPDGRRFRLDGRMRTGPVPEKSIRIDRR